MQHRLLARRIGRRGAVALALTLVATLVLVTVLRPGGGAPAPESGALSGAVLTTQPAGSASFKMATFNLLGNSHTACGKKSTRCQHPTWASGAKRTKSQMALLTSLGIQLAGFQEMETSQLEEFEKLEKGAWSIYPKTSFGTAAEPNQIAWNLSTFKLVSTSSWTAPYFYGQIQKRALVLLRYKPTGQEVYVMDTHNPSDTWGNAQKWRDESVQIEAKLITQLHQEHPTIPVIFTGDMNDRTNFLCPMLRNAPVMTAATGYDVSATTCKAPTSYTIDWMVGTTNMAFSGYAISTVPTTTHISDHNLYYATAVLPPASSLAAGIQHVVLLDVEGLPSWAITPTAAPALTALRTAGASTLNARTDPITPDAIPNAISMVTGVAASTHKVTSRAASSLATVKQAAGSYVGSIFDRAHDYGRTTSLITDDAAMAIADRTWSKGASDKDGPDNGTDKLTLSLAPPNDLQAIADLQVALATGKASALSAVQVDGLRTAGLAYGFGSRQYDAALSQLDSMVGLLRTTIASTPSLASNTVLIVAGDSGGNGTSTTDATDPQQFTVPFLVWGHGVPSGADLYAMNPAYRDPGSAKATTSTTSPPVRTALVANLVTSLLGVPKINNSTFDTLQDFNVLVGP